jgi:hypothetical protein
MSRESRDWRRETIRQVSKVCGWLLVILLFNVLGWLLASFLVQR